MPIQALYKWLHAFSVALSTAHAADQVAAAEAEATPGYSESLGYF